eukprot:CAMPEP_0183405194 /NCGR_PEP_ID=MMETSP0370-20130417/15635_1 /TAXON_ID=268820 /ORGANISM="Peridinium aciculiferum, Strain PAER-2" /LENGTH=126 /DNA_ID=CAMNT_0025587121 /DNA_START=14 /DNA_END=392 /DNA_ORIENTATION=+
MGGHGTCATAVSAAGAMPTASSKCCPCALAFACARFGAEDANDKSLRAAFETAFVNGLFDDPFAPSSRLEGSFIIEVDMRLAKSFIEGIFTGGRHRRRNEKTDEVDVATCMSGDLIASQAHKVGLE